MVFQRPQLMGATELGRVTVGAVLPFTTGGFIQLASLSGTRLDSRLVSVERRMLLREGFARLVRQWRCWRRATAPCLGSVRALAGPG